MGSVENFELSKLENIDVSHSTRIQHSMRDLNVKLNGKEMNVTPLKNGNSAFTCENDIWLEYTLNRMFLRIYCCNFERKNYFDDFA